MRLYFLNFNEKPTYSINHLFRWVNFLILRKKSIVDFPVE